MTVHHKVSIIGPGDFGRALGKALIRNEYEVVYGSRKPEKRKLNKIDKELGAVRVVSIAECVDESDIIILCVSHRAHHQMAPLAEALSGKILVDVSNYTKSRSRQSDDSLAEALQKQLPQTHVVKAFNTMSAYRLETDLGGERGLVKICGNSSSARDKVKQLVTNLNLDPVDCGGLVFARQLEAQPHELFKGWMGSTIFSFVVMALIFTFCTTRFYHLKDPAYGWERFPVNVVNKCISATSVTLLCLVFMPGCLAAFAQLVYGNKYHRFQGWLDAWLRARKQLGLFSMLLAVIHALLSVVILTPAYFPWFLTPKNVTATTFNMPRMTWDGETATLLGILALVSVCVVGITSLPSVVAILNWREWRFVQSYLGWVALLLSVAHIMVQGLGHAWINLDTRTLFLKLSLVSCFLPWLVILMKIVLVLPCIDRRLSTIRHGCKASTPAKQNNVSHVMNITELPNGEDKNCIKK